MSVAEHKQQMGLSGVVAKMSCNAVELYQGSMKVKLGAIYGTEGENKDFSDATPSGEVWMHINNGRPAASYFEPGKRYYVTFTEAPD